MIDSEQSLCAAHTNLLGFEDDLLRWRALRSMLMLETFADHELRKLLFGRLLRCRCGDHLASAHNRHPVSDLIDLSKLMGYENYRFPLFFQPSNHVKHACRTPAASGAPSVHPKSECLHGDTKV